MRSLPLAFVCIAVAAAPLAGALTTSFPFSFLIEDCRATLGIPGDGCSAEIAGTLEAECAPASCLFRLAGDVTGVRAETAVPGGVSASGLVVRDERVPNSEFPRPAKTTLCAAAADAAEVSCAFDTTVSSVAEDWGGGYGTCAFVGVDVQSMTGPVVAGVAAPVGTHAARSGSDPGDSRPPAIGWEVCVEGETVQVLDYVWWG